MIVDHRTPLERYFDGVTRQGRERINAPSSAPSPQHIAVVSTRLGTAHPLNPAEPWMRWRDVFDRVAKLQGAL